MTASFPHSHNSHIYVLLLTLCAFLLSIDTFAQITSAGSGKWHDPATWDSGVPGPTDDVIIDALHTVTYNAEHPSGSNDETVASLTVNGTLNFPFANGADDGDLDQNFILRVTGTTTISGTGTIGVDNTYTTGNNRTHQLYMSGAFSNAGTIDLYANGSRRVDLYFSTNTFNVSGAGTFTFYDMDVIGSAAVTFSGSDIDVDNTVDLVSGSLEVNGGTVDIGPAVVDAFEFAGSSTTFTVTSGTVNVGANLSGDNNDALEVDADNCSLVVDGGALNIGNLTTTGEGRFRINNTAATAFTFDINGGTTRIADDIDYQSATAIMNLDISAGTLEIGVEELGGQGNSEFLSGSINLDGGTAVLELGENANIDVDVDLNNGATLSIGTNSTETDDFDLNSAWVVDGASTLNFPLGLDLLSSSLTVQGNSIVNISNNTTSSLTPELEVTGTLTLNSGNINISGGVVNAGMVDNDIVQIEEGGTIDIQDGTMNIANNVGFTDGTRYINAGGDQAIQLVGATNGTFNIGDGAGGAGTAVVNVSTNLASQGSPLERFLFINSTDDGVTTVSSDGEFNLGGGNIGSLRLDDDDTSPDVDFHFVVNGGTVNVAGSLDIDRGAGYQQTGGTVNVGLAASNGVNNLDLGANNDDDPTIFEVTGGEFNIGDGAINISIGNNNNNPGHGEANNYMEFEVTGGIVNINGRLQLEDANARMILGGSATMNFNPRYDNSLASNLNVLWLRAGIVDIQGPININFLNPHEASGSGRAIHIDGPGSGGGDQITSSYSITSPVDFSQVTWGFGDGTESADGADGFDIIFDTGHTSYGNFVINNPSGSGREVVLDNSGNSYLTENITITAGVFDIDDNDLDDDGAGSTFQIGANGTLRLDTEFPGSSTTNYGTYTLSTGSTVEYNGTAAISNAQVPDGTDIYNLIVSGNATKTISAATNVNGTITLSNGTLATSTNLTMAGPRIIRSAGTLTGDIQGTADYTIEYTGLSKSIDDAVDAEWTGGGSFDCEINLDPGQTITVTGSALSIGNLDITQGTLTDASAGFTHTVSGNLTVDGAYTGLGTISLTGGSATHNLSSSGTATLSNLTMNDASFDASGDLDISITGTLTLTAGDIQVGSGQLTIQSGGSISGGDGSSYIAFDGTNSAGGLRQTYLTDSDSKFYPIGTNTEYTPGTVALNSASGLGELNIVPVASPTVFTLDGSETLDIDYHWILTTDGGFSGLDVDHTFVYDESDVRGVEGSYISARYNVASPAWTNSDDTTDGGDGVNSTTNTITLSGVDFIDGHITAGESDEFSGVITTFYPRSDVSEPIDWNTGSNWTNTDGGTTPINRTPGTNSPVVVNRIVSISDDGMSSGSLNIAASGTLIVDEDAGNPSSGHTLGTVSGEGTLRLISDDATAPTFPDENGGNWIAFLGVSGGTVEFSGDGSYTLPSDISEYRNLTLTGSTGTSTKTLADVDLNIIEDFSITGANTTSVSVSDATSGNLTIGGNLTIEATNTLDLGSSNNRTLSVAGELVNSGTFQVSNLGTASHTLSLANSLASDGTTDFNRGGSTLDVTFTGTDNESISGTGSVDLNRLIVNKGTSQTPILEVTVNTFSITDTGDSGTSSAIELQNGTLTLSTGGTFTVNTDGNWVIPSTAGVILNSGSPTVQMTTVNAEDIQLAGLIQVTSGILDLGDQTDFTTSNDIRYTGTTADLIIDGGILNVGGAIRPIGNDASSALDFTLSSGTVSVGRNASTTQLRANSDANRAIADFALNNALSSFTMTGGLLEIVCAEEDDNKAISISDDVTTYTVSGGTVRIAADAHDAFSSNTTDPDDVTAIYSSVPFWNLEIGDGDYTGDMGNARDNNTLNIQVLNDFTLNINDGTADQGKFELYRVDQASANNANGTNMSVGGSFTITDGDFVVTDDGSDGTITFNGSGLAGQTTPQVITQNGEELGDIIIDNSSGSVNLSADLDISGDWTYSQGTLNQGGFLITMNNSNGVATAINGDASFDDLTLANTNGVSLINGDMTIASGGVLTLNDNVIFDLVDESLTLADQTAGTINIPGGADNTNMIMVSGNTSGRGITRTYPDASTTGFIYPVGTNIGGTDYYLPAQIDLTAGGGAGATINIVLIGSQHPQVTDTENALNVYWSVSASGFDASQTADHTYTYGTDAADIVEGADDSNFLDAFNVGSPTFAWTEGSTTNVTEFDLGSGGIIAISDPGTDNISGDFTAGVNNAFNAVTVFYTLRSGDWDNTTTLTTPWTNDACGGGQTEVTGTQPGAGDPVVVCATHTVTITTATGLAASGTEISTNGQITSDIDDISTIGNIDGSGTLLFSHTTATTPTFGGLSSTFVNSGGGTINYGGTSAYSLPTTSTYNNLIVSNSNTIDLAGNIAVNGDATLNGGTVTLNSFTISDADNGGTFTLGAGTLLEVDDVNNFPDNFGTYTLDATSTVDYIYDNSNDQTVYSGISYGNLDISRTAGDPAVKVLTGNITVQGILDINRRAELQIGSNTLTLQGDVDIDSRNNTNLDTGTGTVIFAGTAGNQNYDFTSATNSETFYNLEVNQTGSGTNVNFSADVTSVTITNNLTVTDEELAMGTTPVDVNGNVTIGANGTVTGSVDFDVDGSLNNAGTLTIPATINLGGDLTNTGTFTQASNTIVLNNTTSDQTISGSATTYNDITISKATGFEVQVDADVTVEGTLALSNEGNVYLNTGDLIVEVGAAITGNAGGTTRSDYDANRMIRTDGTKSDPYVIYNADASSDWDVVVPLGVDDGGNVYTPVVVDATNENITSGTLSLHTVNGTASTDQTVSPSAMTIDRHYDMNITGLTGAVDFDVLFYYDDADVQGDEADYLTGYSEISVDEGWVAPVTSTANTDPANNAFGSSAALDGVITFNTDINTEWTVGDRDLLFPHLYTRAGGGVDCGSITCDWDDNTHWTLSDGGTTAAGLIPGSDNAVTISSGHDMAIDNASNNAFSLEVFGTLDFAATTGHSLGSLTGTGVVQIESGSLGAYVSSGDFFDAGGGTVEYGGVSAYTISGSLSSYNNLTILDGTQDTDDKELGRNIIVYGDLTTNTVDLENSGNYSLELRGAFSSVSGGQFQVNDGTFIWANTSTATLSSDIVFGSSGNLVLDNFGEKDLGATLNINNLTINSSSGTFDANSNNINIIGNWDNQSSSNVLANPGTTTFNSGAAQTIDGPNTFGTTNVSTSSTALTVNSGTQTFTGALTLATGTSLDIGSNAVRIGNVLDVDQGTFTGSAGTVVYTSATDPETQTDPITVLTLEIDKAASDDTFDNDPRTVTFTNLTVTQGEYDGPDLDIPGDLTFGANGDVDLTGITTSDVGDDFSNAATLDLSGLTTMTIAGDYTNTGTLTAPTTVDMDGASAQNLNGNLSVSNFIKSGGGDLTLAGDLTVTSTLTLTDGLINSDASNSIILTSTAANPTGSDNSHVNGPMVHTIATTAQTTKIFPIGDGTTHRPMTAVLTQTDASSRTYTAQVIDGPPPSRTLPMGVDHTSIFRYFNLSQSPSDGLSAGAGANAVTISYESDDGVLVTSDLRLLKDDGGSNWLNLGASVSGTTSSGTVTSTADFSSLSDFVLSSITADISLPVDLISFTGITHEDHVELNWQTASEYENDYFQIAKSYNGKDFSLIGEVDGKGNSNIVSNYQFIDSNVTTGIVYYRLTQVDYNGDSETFSPIQLIVRNVELVLDAALYPNPTTQDNINLRLISPDTSSPVTVRFIDLQGRQVHFLEKNLESGQLDIKIERSILKSTGLFKVLVSQGNYQRSLSLVVN